MSKYNSRLYVIVQEGRSAFHIVIPNLWGNVFIYNSQYVWASSFRFVNRPDMSGIHPRTRSMEEFDPRGIAWVPSKKCAEIEDDLDFVTNDLVDAKCQIARNQETIAQLHKQVQDLEQKLHKLESKQNKSKRLKQDEAARPERDAMSALVGYPVESEPVPAALSLTSEDVRREIRLNSTITRASTSGSRGEQEVWHSLMSMISDLEEIRLMPQSQPPPAAPPF